MKQKTPLSAVLLRRTQRYAWVGLFFVFAAVLLATSALRPVEAATNDTINFQARLQQSNGALVPDGFYNVEFKLYDASTSSGSSQGSCSGDSNCLWTETHYDSNGATAGNDNRIRVANGYLTVNLGSVTAFGSSIDWSQELWLTMNVGGTTQTTTPTWDGEMDPRLKLTAVPYAFSAGELKTTEGDGDTGTLEWSTLTGNQSVTLPDASGVVCLQNASACGFLTGSAADYIQNGTSPQTADFNITGSATAGSLTTGTVDTSASGGTLAVGGTNADNVVLGDGSGTNVDVDVVNSTVGIVAGATTVDVDTSGVVVGRDTTDSATAFVVQSAASSSIFNVDTTDSGAITIGGTDGEATLFVLDTKNTDGDPAGVEGAMYYNSFLGKYRCYKEGAWKNCDGGADAVGTAAPISKVADRGQVAYNSTESSTDVTMSDAGSIETDNFLIARVVWGSSSATTMSVTDPRSNTWTVVGPASVGDTRTYLAYTRVENSYQNNDAITFQPSASGNTRSIVIEEWRNINVSDPVIGSEVSQTGTSTSPSISRTPTEVGQLFYGHLGVDGGTGDTFTQDTDTLEGSWETLTRVGANQTSNGATKVAQGTSEQTWNPTLGTSRDWGAVAVVFKPALVSEFRHGGNEFGETAVLGTLDNNGLDFITNDTTVASLSNTGAATFQNATDSATAMQVQNTAGSSLFNIDTTGDGTISLGEADANTTLFVLDNSSAASDPSSAQDGSMYYNTTMNEFRCRINGSWANCGGTSGGTNFKQGGNSFGTTAVLGTTDTNELHLTTNSNVVATFGTGGAATFQNSTDSTGAFQIQNAAGTGLFTADTTNMDVIVGDSTDGVILSADGLELRGTARHAKAIVMTPEYAGAVLDGMGTGLMTSGYDSTQKTNYYSWTSSETSTQTYDIVVSVPVPSDWSAWAASSELCIETYSSANTLALADLSVFDTSGASDFSASDVTPSTDDTWESHCFALADANYSADGTMTVIVSLDAEDDEFIQVGNITLSYLGEF